MPQDYTIACYYFPNYHIDPRNVLTHGANWTEWELAKLARPRFPGHRQPRVPLWGYEDESDPAVMARKIDGAADHGIDVFLFDWYHYDDGPFLIRALEEGFLRAPNNDRLRFAIHWANHDWVDIHPAKLSPRPIEDARVLYPGAVSRVTFDAIVERVIETYFKHPSYWSIAGCPYFSCYDLHRLVVSFGGVSETRAALDRFRAKVQAAGFPNLHLNAIVWNRTILPGEKVPTDPNTLINLLGFDSFTSYVWIHHDVMDTFPETDYAVARDKYFAYWDRAEADFDLPYYPNITMGWDPSPRTVQSGPYLDAGYPFTATLANNTPAQFRLALKLAKARLERRPAAARVLTLNAWNEWTESSYLEPDTEHGMGYLEAIRDVFGT